MLLVSYNILQGVGDICASFIAVTLCKNCFLNYMFSSKLLHALITGDYSGKSLFGMRRNRELEQT